jgi:hypothetical protein
MDAETRDRLIEQVARALATRAGWQWDETIDLAQESCRRDAAAVIDTLGIVEAGRGKVLDDPDSPTFGSTFPLFRIRAAEDDR